MSSRSGIHFRSQRSVRRYSDGRAKRLQTWSSSQRRPAHWRSSNWCSLTFRRPHPTPRRWARGRSEGGLWTTAPCVRSVTLCEPHTLPSPPPALGASQEEGGGERALIWGRGNSASAMVLRENLPKFPLLLPRENKACK